MTAQSAIPAFPLTVMGTPSLITFSLVGAPAWLSINAFNQLVGTPPANAAYNVQFTIKAQNGVAPNYSQIFTLTVKPFMMFTPKVLPRFYVGQANSKTITTSGGTGNRIITDTLSAPLPAGMTITPSGTTKFITIGGRPKKATTVTIAMTVTDTVGAKSMITYTLTTAGSPLHRRAMRVG